MKSIFVTVLILATLISSAVAGEETCDMLFVQDAKAMITTLPQDADKLFALGTRDQIDQLIQTISTNG